MEQLSLKKNELEINFHVNEMQCMMPDPVWFVCASLWHETDNPVPLTGGPVSGIPPSLIELVFMFDDRASVRIVPEI